MKNSDAEPKHLQAIPASAELKTFFIDHLNRIYCAKSHLVQRLPEMTDQAYFSDLKLAITETLEDVEHQIIRMDEIYVLLDAQPSLEKCNGLTAMVEQAFSDIGEQRDNHEIRDLAILFYLQHIESVEVSSFLALQMIAAKFNNKQILQLLLENFDEAKEDRALLVHITKKYLGD